LLKSRPNAALAPASIPLAACALPAGTLVRLFSEGGVDHFDRAMGYQMMVLCEII